VKAYVSNGHLLWECPGCLITHAVPIEGPKAWTWNGSLEAPTLSPSVLCRWDEGEERRRVCCHSFVRGGRMEFLGDCTHALAGRTVEIPERDS
jgi:hypothetical protein